MDTYIQPADGGGYDGSLDQLTTSYSYDTDGNCTEAVYLLPGEDPEYPNGISESWIYDSSFSQMTSHTDGDGYKTTYNLDGYGNVTEEDDPPTSAGTRVTKYTYTFPPDASSIGQLPGGLVSVETDAAETSKPTTTTTQYVASGNQVGLVQTVTVSQGGGSYTLSYQYDGNRNLTQSTDQYNHVTKYTYDKLNNLLRQTIGRPTGAGDEPGDHVHL